jgi:uncharacterized membrane protein
MGISSFFFHNTIYLVQKQQSLPINVSVICTIVGITLIATPLCFLSVTSTHHQVYLVFVSAIVLSVSLRAISIYSERFVSTNCLCAFTFTTNLSIQNDGKRRFKHGKLIHTALSDTNNVTIISGKTCCHVFCKN